MRASVLISVVVFLTSWLGHAVGKGSIVDRNDIELGTLGDDGVITYSDSTLAPHWLSLVCKNEILAGKLERGENAKLTINSVWQKRAQLMLDHHVYSGCIVLIDLQSNDVLVMATSPRYDINSALNPEVRSDIGKPMLERNVHIAFSIGFGTSTKIPLMLAGAEKREDGKPVFDDDFLTMVFTKSTTMPIHRLASGITVDEYQDACRALGYGISCELPMPGEAKGAVGMDWQTLIGRKEMLAPYYREGRPVVSSGMMPPSGMTLASPIQMARAMGVIANGKAPGRLRLFMDTKKIEQSPALMSERALSLLRNGMDVRAKFGGYKDFAGISSWVQFSLADAREIRAFAGYAPRESPKYAFAIVKFGAPNEDLRKCQQVKMMTNEIATMVNEKP